MSSLVVLKSNIDDSVNFADPGSYEWRYVRRSPEYFIAYLSSQSACSQGCRFCHLTTTGQTRPKNATIFNMISQAEEIIRYYKSQPKAKIIHFNFMARGEPLLNPDVGNDLLQSLSYLARNNGLLPRFLISTIMPKTLREDIRDKFHTITPELCYSIYSTEDEFRRKWLPSSMSVDQALDKLLEWQNFSGKFVKIHYALIKGENDSSRAVNAVIDRINDSGLRVNVNLVQYNPPNDESESATEESYKNAHDLFLRRLSPGTIVRIVPKVGFDVKASCGMFLNP